MGQELGCVLHEGLDMFLLNYVYINQARPLPTACNVQLENEVVYPYAFAGCLAENNPAPHPTSLGVWWA
jgi:hypothetical protein